MSQRTLGCYMYGIRNEIPDYFPRLLSRKNSQTNTAIAGTGNGTELFRSYKTDLMTDILQYPACILICPDYPVYLRMPGICYDQDSHISGSGGNERFDRMRLFSPVQQLQTAIMRLHQCGTAFYPVTTITIDQILDR